MQNKEKLRLLMNIYNETILGVSKSKHAIIFRKKLEEILKLDNLNDKEMAKFEKIVNYFKNQEEIKAAEDIATFASITHYQKAVLGYSPEELLVLSDTLKFFPIEKYTDFDNEHVSLIGNRMQIQEMVKEQQDEAKKAVEFNHPSMGTIELELSEADSKKIFSNNIEETSGGHQKTYA